MPVEGYMWLGSILNNITQKCEDGRRCPEVGLRAANLREQQSWVEEDDGVGGRLCGGGWCVPVL